MHHSLISKSYYAYIASIIHQMTNKQNIASKAFGIFETQYLKFSMNINENISKILKDSSIYISPDIEIEKEEEEEKEEVDPEIENFSWDILNFILVDDLLTSIEGKEKENKFPLKSKYLDYKVGDSICLLDKGVESFMVKGDDNNELLIMILGNVILFGQDMSEIKHISNYAIIKKKFPIREVTVELKDNVGKNKSKLYMMFRGKDSTSEIIQGLFSFSNEEDNNDFVFRLFERITEMKRLAMIKEKEHVKRYFDNIMIEYEKKK